jgi:putative zinc finger protein
MNKCTESDIQEMLPDLLHRTLAADARARVEAHVATCEECREDLVVLRTVKSAAVFAPTINIQEVVGRIPPYRTIGPAIERPVSTRVISWLVAASLAIAVVGGGSLVLTQRNVGSGPPVVATSRPVTPAVAVSGQSHALALGADVGGLSDVSLVQLMDEMNRFDALPAAEPEPVMAVDSTYNPQLDF